MKEEDEFKRLKLRWRSLSCNKTAYKSYKPDIQTRKAKLTYLITTKAGYSKYTLNYSHSALHKTEKQVQASAVSRRSSQFLCCQPSQLPPGQTPVGSKGGFPSSGSASHFPPLPRHGNMEHITAASCAPKPNITMEVQGFL